MVNATKSLQSKVSKKSTPTRIRSRTTKSALLPTEDTVENYIVIPPDGGSGWLVVVASFLCNFFVDGTMYTFGIFLDEISESFNVRVTKVAVTNSIMCGFYFVVGPITCALANRFGFRIVGIIGGIIASIAFLLSTFFDNLIAFHILVGGCCGIGFNMIYIPSILIVGFYFEKWRALATAISVCGSSIGVIVFPPIVLTLLKNFDWKWKFRLLSGLIALTIFYCMLFRPIKPVKVTEIGTIIADDNDNDSIGSFHMEKETDQFSFKQIFQAYHNTAFPTASELQESAKRVAENPSMYSTAVTPSDPSIARSLFTNKTDAVSLGLSTVYEDEDDEEEIRRKCCCNKACCRDFCCWCCDREAYNTSTGIGTVQRPMYRDDIFYAGSLNMLSEYSRSRATVLSGPSAKKSAISYHLSVTRVATQKDIQQNRQCVCCPEAVVRTMVTMLDFKLLKSPSFLLLTLSGFFAMLGIYCPFIFLVKRAEDMNIDKYWSTLLLTTIGISNTVGRITCGAISCFPKMDALIISYVTMFITGGIIIASNYLDHLEGQMTFAIVFGFNIASITVLRSIVIVELVGLDHLTNAFGITTMFYGLASFTGVPVAGALQNFTGKYEASFIFSGCSFLVSAMLLIPIRWIAKWEANKKKPKVTFKD